jgi:hypothetical protein
VEKVSCSVLCSFLTRCLAHPTFHPSQPGSTVGASELCAHLTTVGSDLVVHSESSRCHLSATSKYCSPPLTGIRRIWSNTIQIHYPEISIHRASLSAPLPTLTFRVDFPLPKDSQPTRNLQRSRGVRVQLTQRTTPHCRRVSLPSETEFHHTSSRSQSFATIAATTSTRTHALRLQRMRKKRKVPCKAA